jgi:CRP-like cAMP-binding protein
MEDHPHFLHYGEEVTFPAHEHIFSAGDPVGDKPIYYVIAGLAKLEYPLAAASFPLWIMPDSLFGLVEPLAECQRLGSVQSSERTILYRWNLEGFQMASSISWELGFAAITGLTRELRIMNAEFGERLGRREEGRH